MTSRELLVLLDGLDEDSLYKRSFSGYAFSVVDWPPSRYLLARHVLETAAARGGEFDPTGLVSPVEQAVTAMRERGEWPPAWWPKGARDAAIEADAKAEAGKTPSEDELRHSVSDLVASQLYGRS